jgi:phage baseplate assembly protein W
MSSDAVTLADITSADWSLMLDATAGSSPGSGIGQVVQGIVDVDQCVRIILTTPKGADPLRPTFGADLWQFVDTPVNLVRASIVREITEALLLWEPRIELLRVSTTPVLDDSDQAGAHVNVTATWRLKLKGTKIGGGLPASSSTTVSLSALLR